ncbi:nicotinamide/nicotinic acid mononucleotide adenylyltransferase 3-like isoform X4 [Ptychodera flava]|uniref:nicotinamide/nicotinic acid mononucleotide adenylyltransferase 3-like isoform X4 n=1 Tax=Ptychodera flava TaxID=63121 RepID=UPI00396A5F2D
MILSRLCNMASPAKVVLLACGSFNPITNMHLRMFEVARDHLHKTGRFHVIGGIISPVNDGYAKKGLLSCKHRVAMSRLAAESSTWLTVDPWESEQDTWLETAKVLRHHQAVLDARYISDSVNGNRSKRPELQSSVSHITSIAKRTRRSRSIQQQQQNLDLIESNSNFTTTDDGYFSQINSPEYERPVQLMLLCGADMLESFAVPGLWKEEDIDEIVGKFGIVVINRAGSDPRKFIYDSDALTRLENHIEIVTEWIPNEISSTRVRRALKRRNSVKYLIPDPVIDYIHLHKLYLQEEEKQ